MKTLVAGFASQLKEAQALGLGMDTLEVTGAIHSVYVLGLGGSAFGAEVVRNYLHNQLRVPFCINRSYQVPAAIGPGTLVIASSYSGNTEETLEAASEAQKQGAQVVAITSGGELAAWAAAHGFSCLRVPGGYPPRAAVGFSIVLQLYVLAKVGLTDDPTPVINKAIQAIEAFDGHALAEQLAQALVSRIAVIYAGDGIESVALRLRQQLNENSKRLCWHHTLPELNHNELVGWEGPKSALAHATVVYLRSNFEHPRVAKRFEIMDQILRERGVDQRHTLRVTAAHRLEELLLLLHVVDWVSIYLAEAEGVDPTPVNVIDRLKGALAEVD